MTIEDFKSYVLTLTGNKPFDLKHMVGNKSTLSELENKSKESKIELSEKDYTKEYFTLNYTFKNDPETIHSIPKLYPGKKLSYV